VTGAGSHNGTLGNEWTLAEGIAGEAAGMRLNMLAGTYASGATSATFAAVGTTTAPIWWRGYKTTIGDQDANNVAVAGTDIPSLTFTTGSFVSSGAFKIFSNLDITGASTSTALASFSATNQEIYGCRFRMTGGGAIPCVLLSGGTGLMVRCYVSAVAGQNCINGSNATTNGFMGNYITGGTVGITHGVSPAIVIIGNVFDTIGGNAISFSSGYGAIVGNSIYNPTGHGVTWSITPASACLVANNHFEGVSQASKFAVNNASGTNTFLVRRVANTYFNCTGYENGFGDSPPIFDGGLLAGSGFANAAGHDFTASALLKAAGFPGLYENISAFRGYLDIGAVQRQEQAAGGSTIIGGGEF